MFMESFIFFRGSRLWRCTKGLVTKSHVFRLLPVIFREFHGFLKFRRVARVESAFAEAVRSVVSACSSVIVEVTVIPPHVALAPFFNFSSKATRK